jgi:hypothetical protein
MTPRKLVEPDKPGFEIHCERCGCVSSTVRRDHDNVARCDACYREEFKR